jgi:hypothetical protein
MEGELAHRRWLAAIGSGAAAPVLVTWLATSSRALCVTHRLLPVRTATLFIGIAFAEALGSFRSSSHCC